MRCSKCGYFSFDYLSECKSCGTNLIAARDGLGFTGLRPEIPSLLGSLLSDYIPESKVEFSAESTNAASTFDFGEEVEFGGGFRLVQPVEEPMRQGLASVPHATEEDFGVLDLSDEELELMIDHESETADSQVYSSPLSTGEDVKSVDRSESPLIPQFDISSLPGLAASKLDMPRTEQAVALEEGKNPEDDLVIELSENDLEKLLMELGESGKGGGE